MEKLNILDTEGNIVGEEYRDVVHKKGLLHAEVHVWCVTHDNRLIFQHRSKDKDTYPDLLDATDYHHLARLGRDWGDGILVEYLGKQSKVRCLRNRYPPFNSDILVDTTDETEIVVTDPQLKFVGHVKHRI